MSREHQVTIHGEGDVHGALQWAYKTIMNGLKGGPVVISLSRDKRTTSQNSKMWPMLTDISNHVEWFGRKYSPEDWKDIASGSFRKCEFVPNMEGDGFVVVGLSTSKMPKDEFSRFIEYLYAFGAEKEVPWSEKSIAVYEQYRIIQNA